MEVRYKDSTDSEIVYTLKNVVLINLIKSIAVVATVTEVYNIDIDRILSITK